MNTTDFSEIEGTHIHLFCGISAFFTCKDDIYYIGDNPAISHQELLMITGEFYVFWWATGLDRGQIYLGSNLDPYLEPGPAPDFEVNQALFRTIGYDNMAFAINHGGNIAASLNYPLGPRIICLAANTWQREWPLILKEFAVIPPDLDDLI